MDGPGTDPDVARPLLERVEQAAVLLSARAADLPLVQTAATLGLRTQAALYRCAVGTTTALWHALGVPTRNDLNALRERLALVRHRVDSVRREEGE